VGPPVAAVASLASLSSVLLLAPGTFPKACITEKKAGDDCYC
jgi:hypothetical protein